MSNHEQGTELAQVSYEQEESPEHALVQLTGNVVSLIDRYKAEPSLGSNSIPPYRLETGEDGSVTETISGLFLDKSTPFWLSRITQPDGAISYRATVSPGGPDNAVQRTWDLSSPLIQQYGSDGQTTSHDVNTHDIGNIRNALEALTPSVDRPKKTGNKVLHLLGIRRNR